MANASEVDPKTVAMLGPKKKSNGFGFHKSVVVDGGPQGFDGFFFHDLNIVASFFPCSLELKLPEYAFFKTIRCRDIDLAKRPCGSLILIMSSQLLQETVVSKTIHHQAQGWQAGRIF